MTKNQQRAVALAQRIIEDRETPLIVDDADWHLLLLAAGLNNCRVLPLTVAMRALQCAEGRTGYFAGHASSQEGSEHAMPHRHTESACLFPVTQGTP